MDTIFGTILLEMDALFFSLEKKVTPPVKVPRGRSFAFRYAERSLEQAIVQKLARSAAGLRAALALLRLGYFQEVGTLQRVIDDFNEDILFLSLAHLTDSRQDVHEKFLDAFYREVFENPEKPMEPLKRKRPVVQRADIRQAIEDSIRVLREKDAACPPYATDQVRAISSLYNSFAHGGSSSVLEMYGGIPPRYHLRGMLETPRLREREADLRHQFYRTLGSFGIAALVLGDEKVAQRAEELQKMLEH